MKKKILLLVLCSMIFAGVVSAASIWGTYKGNQIIRITYNGSPIKVSDSPAISYNGQTMIPVYLLDQVGIKYEWDEKNQTVNIKSTSENNTDSGAKISDIKIAIKNADTFKTLSDYGELLESLVNLYNMEYKQLNTKNLDKLTDNLNFAIDSYNEKIEYLNNALSIDDASLKVLKIYFDAIEQIKIVDEKLHDVKIKKDTSTFNKYFAASQKSYKLISEAQKMADHKYNEYTSKALNY